MGLKQYQRLGREDFLYRLSLILEVPWEEFLETPLWKIKSRAFYCGEQRVIDSINRVEAMVQTELALRSENMNEVLRDYYESLKDLVQIEIPLSEEDKLDRLRTLNKKAMEDLRRG